MTTAPLTVDELRREVIEVLDRHGVSLAEFVNADVDDLGSDELRDLWLMVKGALTSST